MPRNTRDPFGFPLGPLTNRDEPDFEGDARACRPTTALPGTEAKIEEMRRRYALRQNLHHPDDAVMPDRAALLIRTKHNGFPVVVGTVDQLGQPEPDPCAEAVDEELEQLPPPSTQTRHERRLRRERAQAMAQGDGSGVRPGIRSGRVVLLDQGQESFCPLGARMA